MLSLPGHECGRDPDLELQWAGLWTEQHVTPRAGGHGAPRPREPCLDSRGDSGGLVNKGCNSREGSTKFTCHSACCSVDQKKKNEPIG